jgi:putative aldouronate transport system permease protein
MIVTSLGAYALSRSGFLLKKPVMIFIIFTMFFGGGMIPTYLLVRGLGMINTVWAILIPNMVATWNLIILRTAFQAIPESLIESVKLDGANDFLALFRIVLPLSKPALAAISLFYAVGKWNEWFSSVLYLTDRSLYPLQMFLREMLILATTSDVMMESEMSKINAVNQVLQKEIIKYATIIVATVPILALYPFLQKYFVKGVMIGSLKG